jgi:hypothetical protein
LGRSDRQSAPSRSQVSFVDISLSAPIKYKVIDDFQQAFEELGAKPIQLIDRVTEAEYVLLRAEEYESDKFVLERETDFDPQQAYRSSTKGCGNTMPAIPR